MSEITQQNRERGSGYYWVKSSSYRIDEPCFWNDWTGEWINGRCWINPELIDEINETRIPSPDESKDAQEVIREAVEALEIGLRHTLDLRDAPNLSATDFYNYNLKVVKIQSSIQKLKTLLK